MIKNLGLVAVALFTIFRLVGYIVEPKLTDAEIHRVVGEPARMPSRLQSGPLKVVTWNIERGVRFDGIVTTLRAMDADVLLLQEVDRFCRRSGYRDVARELATALDMNWVAAGEFQEVGEAHGEVPAVTGQAILSRFPIADSQVTRFREQTPMRWRFNPVQPRRGGRIALEAVTAGVIFFNLHVESGGDNVLRQNQLDEVIAMASRHGSAAVVIAGDLNNSAEATESMLGAVNAAGLDGRLGAVTDERTHIRHAHPIDWIFVRGAQSSGGRVTRIDGVSDHYPVEATLVRSR